MEIKTDVEAQEEIMERKQITKELLVALLPRKTALKRLQNEGWYHIPVDTAPNKRWPPQAMAFFQGKVFGGEEAYKIRYFGEVEQIDTCPRKELFRTTKRNAFKADRLYYRIQIKNLTMRYQPIVSYRPRRIVFLPTTLEKFEQAEQINDLFDSSPIEDRLWSALKYIHVLAERQWKIVVQKKNYFLDFAIFCQNGKLAVETDGYTYHYDAETKSITTPGDRMKLNWTAGTSYITHPSRSKIIGHHILLK